jgi:hypothetical protein
MIMFIFVLSQKRLSVSNRPSLYQN